MELSVLVSKLKNYKVITLQEDKLSVSFNICFTFDEFAKFKFRQLLDMIDVSNTAYINEF